MLFIIYNWSLECIFWMEEFYDLFIIFEYSLIRNIIQDWWPVNLFDRKFVMREIITQTKIGGHISQHVCFRIHRTRYGFNIKIFEFINKFTYLSLVVFQVIRCAINQISHLTGNCLRVPECLYTIDMQIQCFSESLHECFVLSHIICTFPCKLIRRQPTPAPSLFLEPSKYRVQMFGSVSSNEKLQELETKSLQLLVSNFVQFYTILQWSSTI